MSHLSILMLAATLSQAPADSILLNSVPPDADVVLRIRGLSTTKNDIAAMLKAMSPALAAQAEPALENAFAMAKAQTGEPASTEPFVVMLRGVAGKEPGSTAFAVIVKSSNDGDVLKSIAGGKDPGIKHLEEGLDSFNGPDGQTWYAAKGDGTVAFGGDRILVAGFSKPGDRALGKTLAPNLSRKLVAGDIGVYININALSTRYAEPIAKTEQSLFDTFDKLDPQVGSSTVGFIKSIYGGMFESIKEADGLALSLDFSGEGLDVSGVLSFKAESKAAKAIVSFRTSDAAQLGKLPGESSYYIYMDLNAERFQSIQMMSLQMLSPGGNVSQKLAGILAKEHGRIESFGSMSLGNGMTSFQIANLSDPRSYVTAYEGMVNLLKGSDSPLNFFKEIKSTPNVETYRGFSFTSIEMTMDYDKLNKLQPNNPSVAESMRALYGGDKFTTWLGVDDKQMIQLVAPSWSDARAQIDGYFKGDDSVGDTAGFKVTRAKLPKEASILALVSAQGITRQLTTEFSMITPTALKQPPADMPKEPAFIGFSLSPAGPNALEFHLVVPNTVGSVFEKGMVPVFSSPRPPVKP